LSVGAPHRQTQRLGIVLTRQIENLWKISSSVGTAWPSSLDPRMKRILLVLLLLLLLSATVAAHARDHQEALALVSPPEVIEVDEPQPTRQTTVDVRAVKVNRCAGASGRLKLQDTPCSPITATAAPAAASAATDVVDLSALPPRSLKESSAQSREPDARSSLDIALSAGWKLALFVAVGYAIFRGIRAWRNSYALSAALADRRRTR